jgi:hypothetical protein
LLAGDTDALGRARECPRRIPRPARELDGDPYALDVGTPPHGLTISLLVATARAQEPPGALEVASEHRNGAYRPASNRSNVWLTKKPPITRRS